jgi:phytoene dehydrogenase-like protein
MQEITVVGGGLAGLIAAIEAAESGAPVRLLEARSRLGGRAATAPGDHRANLGPHALYTGGSLWEWLVARELEQPCGRPAARGLRFRWQGELRRTPPTDAVVGLGRLLGKEAPVDLSFDEWVEHRAGTGAARALAGLAGPLTFDHDPGRLSADFVWSRMRRILLQPRPAARYVVGGWAALVDRLAERARALGVVIACGAKVDSIDDIDGPVIVALDPGGARRLLGDDSLRVESPRIALLDVALAGSRRTDPYIVSDLDEAGFSTRVTDVVPTLAPDGEELVQLSLGMRPDETLDAAVERAHAIVDLAYPGWRDRLTWSRRSGVRESAGALDLPGTTWRDRPPVGYAPGVWLAGDWVASPGHLAEASCTSAVTAAAGALEAAWSARIRTGVAARH